MRRASGMSRLLSLALLWGLGAPCEAAAQAGSFELAVEAYRAGEYESASSLWEGLLGSELSPIDRGEVLFDLGNAAYRRGLPLVATARYQAALRYLPRDPDLWANLEFARAEAGLPPADGGDFRAVLARILALLTRGEAGWLALLGLLPLALALGGEALRGGQRWRQLALVGLLLAGILAAPRGAQWAMGAPLGHFCVEPGGAALRSEPRGVAQTVGRLDPGQLVERVDAVPGWLRVEGAGGLRGWVSEDSILSHDPR